MAKVTIHKLAVRNKTRKKAVELCITVMREVEVAAKVIASSGTYATGNLARSIHRDGPRVSGLIISGTVGSDLDYAHIVHDGAKIHEIFPKGAPREFRFGSRARPKLRFYWRKAGKIVFMPHIPGARSKVGFSHPGMEGNEFLTKPMRVIARRHGFKVVTYNL